VKFFINVFFVVCFCLILSCEKMLPETASEIKQIKSNLGDYQYMSVDPQLSFDIKKASFKKANTYLGNPEVNYTVTVKQNNLDFPVNEYRFTVYFGVYYNEEEVYDFIDLGEISDKITSISDVHPMYGFTPKSLSGLEVEVKSYSWSPICEFKPYEE